MKKGICIGLVVVLLLAAGVGGYLYYDKNMKRPAIPEFEGEAMIYVEDDLSFTLFGSSFVAAVLPKDFSPKEKNLTFLRLNSYFDYILYPYEITEENKEMIASVLGSTSVYHLLTKQMPDEIAAYLKESSREELEIEEMGKWTTLGDMLICFEDGDFTCYHSHVTFAFLKNSKKKGTYSVAFLMPEALDGSAFSADFAYVVGDVDTGESKIKTTINMFLEKFTGNGFIFNSTGEEVFGDF